MRRGAPPQRPRQPPLRRHWDIRDEHGNHRHSADDGARDDTAERVGGVIQPAGSRSSGAPRATDHDDDGRASPRRAGTTSATAKLDHRPGADLLSQASDGTSYRLRLIFRATHHSHQPLA
ncbi:MAG: hypothetical protein ACHQ4H_16600, partial [Ktedonobacterales bacterium]